VVWRQRVTEKVKTRDGKCVVESVGEKRRKEKQKLRKSYRRRRQKKGQNGTRLKLKKRREKEHRPIGKGRKGVALSCNAKCERRGSEGKNRRTGGVARWKKKN